MHSSWNLLSWLIFTPLIGAVLLYLIPLFHPSVDRHGSKARWFSLAVAVLTFAISVCALASFEVNGSMQLVERAAWIPSFGISYAVGVDGISLALILLTTVLMPVVLLASYSVHSKVRAYLFHMLLLETAMLGTLAALDVFLFYVFWELMLAPMYFIIGIWGGTRRIYATLKFVLYTVFGSVLMLAAILYVVWAYAQQTGEMSFLLSDLLARTELSFKEEVWLFAAFALAFGIKVPIFPFHTWLPDAHVEAPTGGSVILAGVLLKMGIYGFIRFGFPLFPRGAELFIPVLCGLAVIGIVYGALVAWVQTDIKKLVAYSSVSHLGYCVLGLVALNTVATTGSVYQLLNHGISTGALFLLVGVLYDRRHTRDVAEYGGLAAKVPVFAFLFLVFTLSSIALPLTNGFIGEFLILTGSYVTFPFYTTVALLGVILGAVYMLTLYMKTMFGQLDQAKNGSLTDVSAREVATFLPLLILVFWMGLYPQPILRRLEPAVDTFLSDVKARSQMLEEREMGFMAQMRPQLIRAQEGAVPGHGIVQRTSLKESNL
ncbi:MAG: NADH-quinone oxidoreductase subunit M [Bdellovibrionota bacterium]|nr:MAG: NADH-quinone oxidoreductase subunit M [Bdellovibrionota bacterium]